MTLAFMDWFGGVVRVFVEEFEWDVHDPLKTAALLRLTVAAILGGLLGWERGRADKPADIRTMILISTGAAAFAMLGYQIISGHASDLDDPTRAILRADPTRVLSYIISGVGFLGAGAILHSKRTIKGLTTAASIWVVAAIGAAIGVGEFAIGFLLFAFAYITLWTPWVVAIASGNIDDPPNGNGSGDTD